MPEAGTGGAILVFPPLWMGIDTPPLGLAALAAFAEDHAFQVSQLDLNVKLGRWLLERYGQGPGREPSLRPLLRRLAENNGVRGALLEHPDYLFSGISSARTRLAELCASALDGRVNLFLPFLELGARTIAEARPQIVGFSIFTPTQLLSTFALAKLLRQHLGDQVHLTLGGPWCTLLADVLEKRPALFDTVDSVVVGPGEEALLGIARATAGASRLEDVPSCLYRAGGVVRRTPAAPLDLDTLPVPLFEPEALAEYPSGGKVLPYQASLGCYWKRCLYCNYIRLAPRYVAKRPRRVVEQLQQLTARYGARRYWFVDEVMPPDYLREIARHMLDARLEVEWSAIARTEPAFTPELIRALRRAGCTRIFFGLESGSQAVLDACGKGVDLAELRRVVTTCVREGVAVAANFMTGLPGETDEERRLTQELRRELPLRDEDVTLCQFSIARGSGYFGRLRQLVRDPAYADEIERNDVLMDFPLGGDGVTP